MTALRASGIPADHPAMLRALKFVERCQNTTTNDMGWAGTDGGGVYAPHQSKAGGSWNDEQQAQSAVDEAMRSNSLNSYGSMTYNLLTSYLVLDLDAQDPRPRRNPWRRGRREPSSAPRADVRCPGSRADGGPSDRREV